MHLLIKHTGFCLSKTNFSNNNDFRSFLKSLCATFKEFKMHEQIENEYIIGLLQQRCTVHNVHSDNKLSEMLSLLEKGLHNIKSEYEQLNYAQQLKERLDAFTQDFIPHMKEEEEVFQPMLMQYFTYEELKDIKKQVIAQHCSQQQWDCAAEVLKGFSLWSQAEELQKAFKYSDHEKTDYELEKTWSSSAHISQLPTEIMLRLFHYLSPEDLCRCSQVCSSWSELAKTGSLWRHLYPVRWARGDYYSGPPGDLDQEPDEDWVRSRQNEGRAYQEWDEDADVDESDISGQSPGSLAISTAQREKRLLNGIIHNLLPAVGPSVTSIVLAYSSTASSKMVRQILSLCPNITHLDLTQTDVTDFAFDSWSSFGACLSLKHLDLSGCEKISDHALRKLSVGLGDLTAPAKHSSRRDKHAKSSPLPISLMEEDSLGSVEHKRRAIIFKQGPGRWGGRRTQTQVWVLDSLDLADIEDTVERSRCDGAPFSEAETFVETQLVGGLCCCRRSGRRGHRTSSNAAYLQQRYAMTGEIFCGHSTCCTSDAALRTFTGPPSGSDALRSSTAEFRTKGPSFGGRRCNGHETRTEPSGVRRSLRFLSLSGCYQITDLGLRALAQRGGLPALEHLNLSGCLFITEVGLQELVSACPSLNDEHFYYCDNINGNTRESAGFFFFPGKSFWIFALTVPGLSLII
ncbi:F-box/LRR-repeat protein 5 isoform X3 [Takifugu flavidus]|uniref:F-box/LRR-repeat protein 5 isoform X3 n=1 Tax=Takifugu flavidus TaxID=433684 RepID=UPI002544C276|nr:F-box/LRR-repeat protein 5 isoform X3 [Takifugu flavidus]